MITIRELIDFVLTLAFVPVLLFLAFFTLFNITGLVFGFEKNSTVCNHYRNRNRTRFEIFTVPIASYACKPDGGLLQPALSNFVDWMGEVPKQ